MKKLILIMALVSITVAYPKDRKEHMWCEQNWDTCKKYQLELIRIKEKYLPKERECVEKAANYSDMRLCMMDVREQMRREHYEIRKKMLMEVGPKP
ncbi:MAG: hypothetical protein ACK4SM_03060 [Aquificaceae bacterium]